MNQRQQVGLLHVLVAIAIAAGVVLWLLDDPTRVDRYADAFQVGLAVLGILVPVLTARMELEQNRRGMVQPGIAAPSTRRTRMAVVLALALLWLNPVTARIAAPDQAIALPTETVAPSDEPAPPTSPSSPPPSTTTVEPGPTTSTAVATVRPSVPPPPLPPPVTTTADPSGPVVVTFLTPAEDQVIRGTVPVRVAVTNPSRVKQIEFWVENKRCSGVDEEDEYKDRVTYDEVPDGNVYEVNFDSTTVSNGCMTFIATPIDHDDDIIVQPNGNKGTWHSVEVAN